ncbi:MAG: metal-dependent hydrolase [Acidobacteriota bacterium]
MPSPVGHALGGAIVGVALAPWGTWRSSGLLATLGAACRSRLVVTAAVAACLPDLDFLWGRHSMETHSLGAAVLAGLVVWLLCAGRSPRLALAVTLAWSTHVAFDWLGSDDTAPLGVMALWPLSSTFYFADAFVFEAISRRYWLAGFWRHNLWAVITEAAMLVPIFVALVILRRSRDRRPVHAHLQPTTQESS